jgi:outer membrane protein OmpA-like peptidoglycan-associated protein
MTKTLKFMVPKIQSSILLLTAFFATHLQAQDKNLVQNPSFEVYQKCPENPTSMDYSHKLIPFWTYPTIATPDYFNRCGMNEVRVPNNFAGQSEPKTGNAYMGAILTGTEYNYREYFEGTFKTPLEKGKKYCVTFYYKLASYSRFAVDQLSIYFTPTEVRTTNKENLNVGPQINSKPGLFLDNIDEWEQFCDVYTASGNEKFFEVGNFKNYDHTNYVVTDKNMTNLRNKSYAYYFFDDFSVKPLENCNDCPCVPHSMDVALIDSSYTGGFDPRTGMIKGVKNDGKITLAIRGGTPPYEVQWSNKMTGPKLTNLPGGVYTYKAFDQYNCNSSGTIVFKTPEIPSDAISDGLKNIEEGTAIVLQNIFFEYNKTALLPTSYTELDKVVAFMKESGVQLIEISGHTDSDGSDVYNKTLSLGRAKAVVDYLVSQGIEPQRLRASGYGKSRPIETNLSAAGKGVNRRVEFFLVKK